MHLANKIWVLSRQLAEIESFGDVVASLALDQKSKGVHQHPFLCVGATTKHLIEAGAQGHPVILRLAALEHHLIDIGPHHIHTDHPWIPIRVYDVQL